MNANDSFIIGWSCGKRDGRELTSREVAVQFPDVDEQAFVQGNIDGVIGDRFRLGLLKAEYRGIAKEKQMK